MSDEKIISEEGRVEIDAHLKTHGLFYVAVADIDPKIDPDKEGPGKVFSQPEDGYVYTIGFHKLGLPEVVVFVGPGGVNPDPVTESQLRDRLQIASKFISYIFKNRDTFVPQEGVVYKCDSGDEQGLCIVLSHDEHSQPSEESKTEFLGGICEYYNTMDFKVRSFVLRKEKVE